MIEFTIKLDASTFAFFLVFGIPTSLIFIGLAIAAFKHWWKYGF